MRTSSLVVIVSILAASAVAACSNGERAPQDGAVTRAAPTRTLAAGPSADDDVNPRLLRRFQPLPSVLEVAGHPASKALVGLGRSLYFEKRLSRNGDLSCNSCHVLSAYGVDQQKTSPGFDGKLGSRNSPTVYNAAGHFAQFWDGRAADVEAQAKGPILNPGEMAMPDAESVVAVMKAIPAYQQAFARAFPEAKDPITYDNVGTAIGAFERGLLTPGRWDDFLRGDRNALTAEERRGLKTFLNIGCMVCHTGAYLGGSMFERVGVVEPWPNQGDTGRAGVTKTAGDRMMFKVPSLRNVEKTAPYFHDGSAATLEEAVRLMGKHQLGLELAPDETASIVCWLKSLTGPLPAAEYIAEPKQPGGT